MFGTTNRQHKKAVTVKPVFNLYLMHYFESCRNGILITSIIGREDENIIPLKLNHPDDFGPLRLRYLGPRFHEYFPPNSTFKVNEMLLKKRHSRETNIININTNEENDCHYLFEKAVKDDYTLILAIQLKIMSENYSSRLLTLYLHGIKESSIKCAVVDESLTVIKTLLNYQIDINLRMESGWTLLHVAINREMPDLVEFLIINGADVNIQNDELESPLHIVAKNGNLEILNSLLESQAKLDEQDNNDQTPLHVAVTERNVDVVKILLKEGANYKLTDPYDCTPLHLATQHNNLEMIKVFLENNVNADILNSRKQTPLFCVSKKLSFFEADAKEMCLEIIHAFLQKGANINHQDVEGHTLLHHAVRDNNSNFVQVLLECNANVTIRDNEGENVLHLACYDQENECLQVLLDCDINIDAVDKKRRTALYVAIENNNCKAVELLLKKNAKIQGFGEPALHEALKTGCLPIVKLLLENGADVNLMDTSGLTALHLAIKRSANIPIEIIESILDSTNDFNARDTSHGGTAVHYAAFNQNDCALKALLKVNANINVKDNDGDTPLHLTIYKKNQGALSLECIKTLVNHRADVNAVNNKLRSPLHVACLRKNAEVVKYLRENGADLSMRDNDGNTPLHLTMYEENQCDSPWECIKILVSHGADVNAVNDELKSPLHVACLRKNAEVVKYLLENGADLSMRDNDGNTPLHLTMYGENQNDLSMECIKILVNHQADVNAVDNERRSPLHIACALKYAEVVKYLLENGVDVNVKDCYSCTPLYLTLCEENQCNSPLECIKILVNHQADVNSVDNESKNPLHMACLRKNAKVVEYLLENGVNVNVKDCNGYTPLHLTMFGEYQGALSLECIKTLVNHKADVNAVDDRLRSPLHVACLRKNAEVVKYLLENGADLSMRDNDGNTPLHLTMYGENQNDLSMECIKILVNHQADVNAVNNKLRCPLHVACLRKNAEVVKYLLENGADLSMRDNDGNTPLHLTMYGENQNDLSMECIKILVNHQADVNAVNNKLGCPLHVACLRKNAEVVKYLLENGADLSMRDNDGDTPLHLTIYKGNQHDLSMECIKILVNHQADVNAVNNKLRCPLHVACLLKNAEVVKYLLENCVDVNVKDYNGNTPLHLTLYGENQDDLSMECIKILVNHRADVNAVNNERRSLLHVACLRKNAEVVKYLLENGADLSMRDNDEYTSLHLTMCGKYQCDSPLECIKILVNHRADVNAVDDELTSPLHVACLRENAEVVRYLLENGADLSMKDNDGNTPLHLTMYEENQCDSPLECIKILVSHGADVNAVNNELKSPLHVACLRKNAEVVKYLLENGADLSMRDNDENTPLHLTMYGENQNDLSMECIKILVNHQADVNAVDNERRSPLHIACVRRNAEVVKYLLENGADLSMRDNDGYTPLYLTMCGKNHGDSSFECIKILVNHPADVNAVDDELRSPLHVACVRRNAEVVKFLLKNGVNVNVKDRHGVTPLHLTIYGENQGDLSLECIEILVNHRADVNAVDDELRSPLHVACVRRNAEVVKYLLKNGVNVNVKDRHGVTPLHLTIYGENQGDLSLECIEILVNHRADVNAVDDELRSPLHVACVRRNAEVVKYLLEKGVDVNVKDCNGHTPLHLTIHGENYDDLSMECIKILVNHQANVNAVDDELRSPLHVACMRNNADVVEYLLENGADLSMRDNDGNTPLHLTMCGENQCDSPLECIKILVSHGADVNAVNDELKSPLHVACLRENAKVVKYLLENGVDLSMRDHHGNTPLHVTIHGKNQRDLSLECIKILVNHRADVNAVNNRLRSPLHVACLRKNAEVVEYLLENGVDLNVNDCNGHTPLHLTIYGENHNDLSMECIKILVNRQADVNAVDDELRSLLHVACLRKNTEVVKYLLEIGVDVNVKDCNGHTPLHLTMYGENQDDLSMKCIKILVNHQADVNAVDDELRSLLHVACLRKNAEVVEYLLENGVDVNVKDYNGDTPLHLTIYGENHDDLSMKCIKILVNHQADVNAVDDRLRSPLHVACLRKNAEVVEYLLKNSADLSMRDNDGNTSLHLTMCEENQYDSPLECIKILVNHRADVNAVNNDLRSLLHVACLRKNAEVVEYLLENGVDVNVKDYNGDTPLHLTIYGENQDDLSMECIKILVNHQADVTAVNNKLRSPLHVACLRNNADVVKYLLETGADSSMRDNDGYTPLHLTMFGEYQCNLSLECIKTLVNHKADVNAVDDRLRSLLHVACLRRNAEVVEYLLENDADLSMRDNDGNTSLHLTMCQENQYDSPLECIKILVNHQADVNAVNNKLRSPLHVACLRKNAEVVIYLLKNGADLRMRDNYGNTSLHLTIYGESQCNSCSECTKILVNHQADVNAVNNKLRSPLHVACYRKNAVVVKYLLENGADLSMRDNDGNTPLHLTMCEENQCDSPLECIKILVNHQADINAVNNKLRSPLYFACLRKDVEVVKYLLENGADLNIRENDGRTVFYHPCMN